MGVGELVMITVILSVNQMAALATINLTHKMLLNRKPEFVVNRMVLSGSRLNTMSVRRPASHQLKLTGEGFLERAARLWNTLPLELRNVREHPVFKRRARMWIKEKFPPKPS